MKNVLIRVRNLKGFSLVEVLIALLLSGIVTTAAFQAYVNQHKNYIVQDDVTNIQQNVRASIDQLNRQIRLAGYQLPSGLPAIVAANTNPDTITITYRNDACNTFLSDAMPQPSAELKCGSDVSCFQDNQWVYIWEADSAKGEWFQMTLTRKYGTNSNVLSLVQIKFYVDKSDTTHPKLMMLPLNGAPQIFADDITDLQFTYRLTNNSVVNVPASVSDVVEVLISVSGRSSNPDVERPTGQQYRTRTYSSSVSLRNRGV
jgi:prepilin-type N-terminal cleavage/methylation domain-containing protein